MATDREHVVCSYATLVVDGLQDGHLFYHPKCAICVFPVIWLFFRGLLGGDAADRASSQLSSWPVAEGASQLQDCHDECWSATRRLPVFLETRHDGGGHEGGAPTAALMKTVPSNGGLAPYLAK